MANPFNTVVSYPIPAYQNLPIEPQFFQPSRFVISAIALGKTTTITTSTANNYVIGQQIRLVIPNGFGCGQLNGQTGIVIGIISPTQLTINLSSMGADPFVNNTQLKNQPQTIAIGDINTGIINSNGETLPFGFVPGIPGSFENISPL